MRPTAFPDDWYEPWCRLWLGVQGHETALTNWFMGQPAAVPPPSPVPLSRSRLDRALAGLAGASPTGPELAAAHACLRDLERRHGGDAQSGAVHAPLREVRVGGARHLLMRPLRQTLRPAADAAGRFPLSSELAIDQVLGLDYRWLALPAETMLEPTVIADLDGLRGLPAVRFGLAPLAGPDDMAWSFDPADARHPDGRVPIRCRAANDPEALGRRLEAVLHAAWDAQVHILLLPELVVDEALLQRCRDWLERHNLREVRLRLVVAGSRHLDIDGGFANRCTVLGPDGEVRWHQDKGSPFVIDDPKRLATLCPETGIAKLVEPTRLEPRVVLAESAIGRLLTPICLDYLEGAPWAGLGADLYLVPAMTEGLSRFDRQARHLGGRHGAASLVCNAQTAGEHRVLAYLPLKRGPSPAPVGTLPLFTIDAPLCVLS